MIWKPLHSVFSYILHSVQTCLETCTIIIRIIIDYCITQPCSSTVISFFTGVIEYIVLCKLVLQDFWFIFVLHFKQPYYLFALCVAIWCKNSIYSYIIIRPRITCSTAGVREAVGREGLQRFMGEKSDVVTSRAGGLICRIFGGLRVFPELWVLTVVQLLTEDELVSVSTKLVSSPDRLIPQSTWWTQRDR